ncbi:FAD/NAD(P)-binding domain-containing protein [Aspergillus ellipticus CBS 707.79]|uniref:FAD/NAD(P)-binding domain-containing protein n=1 Tax=Aspergillus ellipticus CBS 707.79 TaxID=1448320 RepID=A0A319DIW0_9EURO|nr:FAD/NAD(P)-binding domain-containing protein [Aspergillus ellipticus CBS 707.79]
MTTPEPTSPPTAPPTISIAIIGSGIIGTILALGLLNLPSTPTSPKLSIKIYEQSTSPREIGAGIGFTATARKCMELMDPRIAACITAVATLNGEPSSPDYSMRFVDGFRTFPTAAGSEYDTSDQDISVHGKVYKLYAGPRGFEGCHRAHFLGEMMKLLPEGVVEFGKRVDGFGYLGGGGVRVSFEGGEEGVECDLVIACDGIKSRVRELLFSPAYNAKYAHQLAFRGLVPMDRAIEKLGRHRALKQHMHCGPHAHVLHFPVAKQQLMNVVAFVPDPKEWDLRQGMTAPASRSEVVDAFREWGPFVRGVIDLLPEEMDKWAVFDTYDCPVPAYAEGRVALAGDAAHASSPHHGAGAGMGVEDALALVAAMGKVREDVGRGVGVGRALDVALQAYSKVRYERSQWLVRSSRHVCRTYEWEAPDIGADMDQAFADIRERSHKIWYFDVEAMVADVQKECRRLMQ